MKMTKPDQNRKQERQKRASMPDPIECGRLLGRPRYPDAGDVDTGTPMLIPMTGNGMVMWRPPLFDYGRKVWCALEEKAAGCMRAVCRDEDCIHVAAVERL